MLKFILSSPNGKLFSKHAKFTILASLFFVCSTSLSATQFSSLSSSDRDNLKPEQTSAIATHKLNSINFAFEANTGTLAKDTTGPFDGNSFQLSAEYAHNYKDVSWLSWYSKALLKASITPNSLNRAQYEKTGINSTMFPDWMVNGVMAYSGVSFDPIEFGLRASHTFDFGLNLNGYAAVCTNLLLKGKAEVGYNIPAPSAIKNHKIFLAGSVQAFPYRIGAFRLTPTDNDGQATDYSLRELLGTFGYSITFPFNLGLQADASWITNGSGTGTASGGNAWETFDSAAAILYNGFLRVNFTVSYNFLQNGSVFAQFRYEGKTLMEWPVVVETNRRGRTMHDFYVRCGLSWKLGF